MADSLCGPSNGAKNLVSHINRDRSLQQDRIVGGASHGAQSVSASNAVTVASFRKANVRLASHFDHSPPTATAPTKPLLASNKAPPSALPAPVLTLLSSPSTTTLVQQSSLPLPPRLRLLRLTASAFGMRRLRFGPTRPLPLPLPSPVANKTGSANSRRSSSIMAARK